MGFSKIKLDIKDKMKECTGINQDHCHEIRYDTDDTYDIPFRECVPFHERHCEDCHGDCRCFDPEG